MKSKNQRQTLAVAMLLVVVTGVLAFGRRRTPQVAASKAESAAELHLRHPLALSVGSPVGAPQRRVSSVQTTIGSGPLAPIPAERRLIALPPASNQLTVLNSSVPRRDFSTRTHRIVEGDSLEQLAEKYLGSREHALKLFKANRHVLKQPDVLPLGKRILIPSAELQFPVVRDRPRGSLDLRPLKSLD